MVYACRGFYKRMSWKVWLCSAPCSRRAARVSAPCGRAAPAVLPPPCVLPQLVYMGFDTGAATAALRVFRGNVQLAAQTLALNGGNLPSDLQLAAEDSSSTPSTSPSDSAGRSAGSEDQLRAMFC